MIGLRLTELTRKLQRNIPQAGISKTSRRGLQKYNLSITLLINSSCELIVGAVAFRQAGHELMHGRAAEKSS